jgi:hypothetical protein
MSENERFERLERRLAALEEQVSELAGKPAEVGKPTSAER